jgi:transposase
VIVVGIDPHKRTHTAVAIDAQSGELIGEITVAARRRGHERLIRWASRLGQELRVAVEDCRHVSGGLERLLLERGVHVVRVPPRLMGRARTSGRTRGKSDAIDALAVARAALAHPDLPVATLAGPDREIRLLLAHREDLVAERTGVVQRLRWHLHDLVPALEPPAQAFNRRRWRARVADTLAALPQGAQARIAAEQLERVEALCARIDGLEEEIAALVRAHAAPLLELPGCGALTAAKLVGEIAGVARFATPAKLARYAGVAPVPASSGERVRHRLDRYGNRQLNCALHRLAMIQGRYHEPARAFLARKEAEGRTRREAMRALKRHLVGVVFHKLAAMAQAA